MSDCNNCYLLLNSTNHTKLLQQANTVFILFQNESQYVLSEEYSAKSIRDFIYNFTIKNLKRSLRSHVDNSWHTHYFASDGKNEQMGIGNDTMHIIDLTTKSFKRMVKSSGLVRTFFSFLLHFPLIIFFDIHILLLVT